MQNRNSSLSYPHQTSWSSPIRYDNQKEEGAQSYYAAATSPLHPDTLLPMKENDIDSARISQDNRTARDSDSWQLGLVLAGQGKVQKVVDGTPAHKAKMVFESQVTTPPYISLIIEDNAFVCSLSSQAFGKAKSWQAIPLSAYRVNLSRMSGTNEISQIYSRRVRSAKRSSGEPNAHVTRSYSSRHAQVVFFNYNPTRAAATSQAPPAANSFADDRPGAGSPLRAKSATPCSASPPPPSAPTLLPSTPTPPPTRPVAPQPNFPAQPPRHAPPPPARSTCLILRPRPREGWRRRAPTR